MLKFNKFTKNQGDFVKIAGKLENPTKETGEHDGGEERKEGDD